MVWSKPARVSALVNLLGLLGVGTALLACVECARGTDTPPATTATAAPVVSVPAATSSAGSVAASATAPTVTTANASSSAPADAGAPATSSSAGMTGGPIEGSEIDGGTAQFRACKADSDCVAIPRVGCCGNGWLAAVNTSQQAAYKASFTCPPPRPMCPMYVIHDTRTAKCAPDTHLCTMTK